jgi:hypothetical protein
MEIIMGEPLEERQERRREIVKQLMAVVEKRYNFQDYDNVEDGKLNQAFFLLCWYGIENGCDIETQFNEALFVARQEYPFVYH